MWHAQNANSLFHFLAQDASVSLGAGCSVGGTLARATVQAFGWVLGQVWRALFALGDALPCRLSACVCMSVDGDCPVMRAPSRATAILIDRCSSALLCRRRCLRAVPTGSHSVSARDCPPEWPPLRAGVTVAQMPPKRAMKAVRKRPSASMARLSVFTRGAIWGMHVAGMSRAKMQKHVRKTDGSEIPLNAIDRVISSRKEDNDWEGSQALEGGRPRSVSDATLAELSALVIRERGSCKVTVAFCKKTIPALRKVHNTTVQRYLHEEGLKWLTRRRKAWVPPSHKHARVAFATSVKRMHTASLARWAYTDGTSFYLARGPSDVGQKQRAALGGYVWRQSTGADGLYDDNIGPSLYAKAQGLPVKIWGFLANGRLEYWVLPADPQKPGQKTTHMNGARYQALIKDKFASWRKTCFGDREVCHLIQDHERCLWQTKNIAALRAAGCPVVENFPKSSPDLNAIEGAWHLIRQRLEQTEPKAFENRAAFLGRLRRAVQWINSNQGDALLTMCTNQKLRADDVLKLSGARTKW